MINKKTPQAYPDKSSTKISTKGIILIFLSMFLISSAFALPIYVKPLDGSGNLQPSTSFSYEFNFTTNSDCSGVVLTNTSTITTAKDGVGFIDINISGISSIPSYLCEYKDGSLRATHVLPDQIFRDVYARDVNVSGNMSLGEKITFAFSEVIDNIIDGWVRITGNLQVDGDVNVTGSLNVSENITASYFFGDGSELTGISGGDGNASSICSTSHVLLGNGSCMAVSGFFDDTDTTYTNSSFDLSQISNTGNLDLGNNNFTINGTTFFVDTNKGRVGIGTTSPLWKLDISNSTQGIIMSPNKGSQNNPIMNTTGTTNLTITSSGGSVIIRLG